MIESPPGARQRRLLVPIPVTGDIRPLLRHAARLAASLQADLTSLLVEEDSLWQMAALPFVRQVSFATARIEPLDEEDLRRHLQILGRLADRILGEATRDTGITATVRHVRGRIGPVLQEASLPGDIVLLQTAIGPGIGDRRSPITPQALAELPPCDVLVVHMDHAEPARIVVCDDGTPAAAAAIHTAIGLARRLGRPLTVLGADPPASGLPAGAAFRRVLRLDAPAILTLCAGVGEVFLVLPAALAERIGTDRLLGRTIGLLLVR